ncbi:MAG: hypothetical protein LCH79_16400 [Proteobacteria bacterium]|nr:hypothetical protein [Pseudomonadota bacterium]
MITTDDFLHVVHLLGEQGEEDIAWAESLTHPMDADEFASEAIFVICNSGMKNTVAARIYDRVQDALDSGTPVLDVFKHVGKAGAIERIWREREALYAQLMAIVLTHDDPAVGLRLLDFCESLPWIGGITKYHLAKNFGADVAKPDVHLQRLADREGCTVQALCERLAVATTWRVATVDTLLWRACALGVIHSPTGRIEGRS